MKRTLVVVVLLVVVASQAWGGGQSASGPAPQTVVPITLRLSIDQHPATVTVPNGGLARIEVRNRGTHGLVPAVHGEGVALALMEITIDAGTGRDVMRGIGSLSLTVGVVQQTVVGDVPLEVELVEIAPPQSAPPVPTGPCTSCCVTCGEQTVCGCYVVLECSRCCCPAGGCGCIADGSNGATCTSTIPRRQSAALGTSALCVNHGTATSGR